MHPWSLSRSGNWVVKQWTSKKRYQRGLKAIAMGGQKNTATFPWRCNTTRYAVN